MQLEAFKKEKKQRRQQDGSQTSAENPSAASKLSEQPGSRSQAIFAPLTTARDTKNGSPAGAATDQHLSASASSILPHTPIAPFAGRDSSNAPKDTSSRQPVTAHTNAPAEQLDENGRQGAGSNLAKPRFPLPPALHPLTRPQVNFCVPFQSISKHMTNSQLSVITM